jgi:PPM family protein phosphatase
MSPFRRRRRPTVEEGASADAAPVEEGDPISHWQASVVGHRTENQDRCAASSRWAVVSDGMGGHAGGALAAELTRDAAVAAIGEDPDGDDLGAVLADAVRRANQAVRIGQETDPSVAGMGATLVAAVAVEVTAGVSRWVVANIGDSPAWLVTASEALQVTTDHTLAAAMEAARDDDVDDPIPERAHHLLMRAIGLADDEPPDVHDVVLEPGDALVLASDGVSDVFGADAVAAAVRAAGPDGDPARSLVDAALEAGTSDNVTVVVLRHEPDPAGP